jgi:hypothetical protein
MTQYSPALNMEEQNAILGSVTTLLVHRLPGDWEQLFLDVRVMGAYLETEASGLTIFGSSFQWQLPDEALPFFLELREGMARPETGTWFSVKYRLTHPDTYSVEFNRDTEPAWLQPPEPGQYVEELRRHPRSAASTPDWLSARSGSPPPTAPPEHVATERTASADPPASRPRVISDGDQRVLERLRERLEHYGVRAEEYGIISPKPDALVIEPAPGPAGWQVRFWDASRGPHGRSRVYDHAVDAAKVLLAELLWRDDRDDVRAGGRERPPAAHEPAAPADDILPLPGEPPLSLLRDRTAIVLPPGSELDRFGAEGGNLVYVVGTPFGERSLPPDWLSRPYHVYRVERPVPALRGVAVPWFGQAGGGTGYFLARAVRDLLADGSVVESRRDQRAPSSDDRS